MPKPATKKAAPPKTPPRGKGRPATPKVYKQKPEIGVSLRLMGRTFTATGPSITGAIEALSIDRNMRGAGVLVVSNGVKTIERIIQPVIIARLFSPQPFVRQVALKNLFLMIEL